MTLITPTKFNLEVRKRVNGVTKALSYIDMTKYALNSIVHATNNKRYPVLYYKVFRSHRPAEVNIADNPFFLAINHRS